MELVFARQPFPSVVRKTIFLMGPTPRDRTTRSWRPDAIEALRGHGFTGHVFVPENPNFTFNDWDGVKDRGTAYAEQVEWEEEGLNRADVIFAWVPRHPPLMMGLTTNDEFGFWKGRDPSKMLVGFPNDAEKVTYQRYYAERLDIPVFNDIDLMASAAVRHNGAGTCRNGGECHVPLHIWHHPTFRDWFYNLTKAGHKFVNGRVSWTHRVRRKLFSCGFQACVEVAGEDRRKCDEYVVCRPDVSVVVPYFPLTHHPMDTKVVLVREYRLASATRDGFVWELPGGSSWNEDEEPLSIAAGELFEETGIKVPPKRIVKHMSRQVAGTMAAHRGHLYSVQLTMDELAHAVAAEREQKTFGVAADGEQTQVRVRTVEQLLLDPILDWQTLGQVMQVLNVRNL